MPMTVRWLTGVGAVALSALGPLATALAHEPLARAPISTAITTDWFHGEWQVMQFGEERVVGARMTAIFRGNRLTIRYVPGQDAVYHYWLDLERGTMTLMHADLQEHCPCEYKLEGNRLEIFMLSRKLLSLRR